MKNRFKVGPLAGGGLLLGWFSVCWLGCQREPEIRWQGYLEGEYVYVGASLPGRLEHLAVSRGEMVEAGQILFRLDRTVEAAQLSEAQQRLAQAQARLADLRKGQRPSEMEAVRARLAQAEASLELSGTEAERVRLLYQRQVVSAETYDQARFAYTRDQGVVKELRAQLETAGLGARDDTIVAGEAEVAAARANVEQAQWSVQEKTPSAPGAALVYDTLYRAGEMVTAGQPVVVLLPPGNLKVRFFVPEAVRGSLTVGDQVQVSLSGATEPLAAEVAYLSPQAEFTPPVLYNRENRAKLVYMVEAVFAPDAGVELRPGQPVDVTR